MSSWVFLWAALGALTYVAAALTLKRAAELGAGLWHSTWVSNVLVGLLFQILLLFPGEWMPVEMWYQPMLVALLFLAGQVLTLFSFQRGDVSVATPVLGLKIVMVAVLTTLIIGSALSWQLWLAAILSTLGIVFLNQKSAVGGGGKTGITVLSSGMAAGCYALFDVLVQKWSPAWGIGTFLPVMMGMVGVFSLPVGFLFPSPLLKMPTQTLKWLVGGGLLFALQSIFLVASIGYFGQATTSNVIYSSRGLLSVAAVMLIGHWFSNAEKDLEAAVMKKRFVGAALMFVAILLVLI
ncbi:EamA/RhaT family transporter [Phragmitibacter flavus]|uniref:EamA/RhaT family transporter n=1 Tax=Phragmitibacter flavus TaxID=2576071 RepID=A0A5R8KEX6_9BACT|nr:EamA family transporter [Phragmitibacter flavus]TLD70844.1 EamA/RhaT family transporter [Phragmitibacter flavus]